MKQWKGTLAVVLAAGLVTTPLIVYAEHHEKAGAAEEKGAHAEGSGSHSHNGAKKEGQAEVKEAGSPEEGSSAGHGSQAEKKEEGSH